MKHHHLIKGNGCFPLLKFSDTKPGFLEGSVSLLFQCTEPGLKGEDYFSINFLQSREWRRPWWTYSIPCARFPGPQSSNTTRPSRVSQQRRLSYSSSHKQFFFLTQIIFNICRRLQGQPEDILGKYPEKIDTAGWWACIYNQISFMEWYNIFILNLVELFVWKIQ